MRILVVGGGGREHALAWALAKHGHALAFTHENPGFLGLGEPRGADALAAAEGMDLVVVGPEAPLAEGLVDALTARGIPAFGPTRAAARLETSKVFAKAFALRHGLPTARSRTFSRGDAVAWDGPGVVKLDGLAAGKGVWVCDAGEVAPAIGRALAMRDAPVLVEERLEGPELSVLALSDGERCVPLLPARDHKRRFDGDEGPNTGGMGAVAPVDVPAGDLAACHDTLRRAIAGMAHDGTPFRGVLYGGFMLTREGPRLLEFNVRFGDPECQPLVTLLDEDPAPWFLGAARGRLPDGAPRWKAQVACCVVVAGEGYPERPADAPIEALPKDDVDLVTFQAGTRRVDGQLRAVGGRVLGVTGLGPTLAAARMRAYHGVREVRFAGASWRTDIGASWPDA
ncbi:MAG: phosphoribosylamine--glycine ligase [Myxococcota bacterium]